MFIEIIKEATISSFQTMFSITLIVLPILFILRFARETEILNKVSSFFEPLTKKIFLSKEATFPLIVGTVFGLTYGAGVIIQVAREGRLTARDMILINVFLGLNHGVIEDTVIFAAIGANPWWLFSTRTVLAIVVTYLVGWWLVRQERNNQELLIEKN